MSLVRGHWRNIGGKKTWISEHYRNEGGDISCGFFLIGPVLAFLAPGLICFALKEWLGIDIPMPELVHCIISLVIWLILVVLTIKLNNSVLSVICIVMVLLGPALCILYWISLWIGLIGAIIDYFK